MTHLLSLKDTPTWCILHPIPCPSWSHITSSYLCWYANDVPLFLQHTHCYLQAGYFLRSTVQKYRLRKRLGSSHFRLTPFYSNIPASPLCGQWVVLSHAMGNSSLQDGRKRAAVSELGKPTSNSLSQGLWTFLRSFLLSERCSAVLQTAQKRGHRGMRTWCWSAVSKSILLLSYHNLSLCYMALT